MRSFFETPKIKAVLGTAMALITAALFALTLNGTVQARESLDKASYCSFVIPPEFVPGSEKGLFVNRNYPMESSSIKYGVYDNGLDRIFTNREKKGEAIKAAGAITDDSVSLTEDIYKETVSAAYNSEYGHDVGYSISEFTNITVDGFPGYMIKASYQPEGEEVIHQRVIMIISKFRTFTVTMQRAEDDDCEAYFDECASSIHVHRIQ